MKVPLRDLVLLRILVPLLVGITNRTLAVAEKLVLLLCPYPPSWEQGFGAYGFVTTSVAISNLFSRRVIADAERDSITILLTGSAILRYCSVDRVLACACVIDSGAAACVGGLNVAVLL